MCLTGRYYPVSNKLFTVQFMAVAEVETTPRQLDWNNDRTEGERRGNGGRERERERETETERQTDRQTDRQAGRQAGRQSDRQIDIGTSRQTDRDFI